MAHISFFFFLFLWFVFVISYVDFPLDVHPLLLHAEELHQSALDLSLNVFGEMNVQTAKHYGNLGRLYQSMAKYYVSAKSILILFIWQIAIF